MWTDDLSLWLSHPFTRRSLAFSSVVLAAQALACKEGLAQVQLPPGSTLIGDCSVEPGLVLLGGFNLGLLVVTIPELLAPLDWQRYVNFETGLTFSYPNDWTGGTLWAEQLSPNGAPILIAQQPLAPANTTARIVSPDGSASFEFAKGTIYGALFSPLQAAALAELGMVGETARLTPICSYEDPNPLAPSWVRAVYVDDSVLVTQGLAWASPSALLPNTLVIYQTMIGRRFEFETLKREVFLRILFQFKGGGGDEPTPTPTF